MPAATSLWLPCSNPAGRLRRDPRSHRHRFPAIADAVPTSVVLGPDGAYYVSELTGVPFVDTRANVYRVVPADEPQMFFIQDACLTGFKMILDMAFDAEGNLYVLQHSTGAFRGQPREF